MPRGKGTPKQQPQADPRHGAIAQAAYYKAKRRGFVVIAPVGGQLTRLADRLADLSGLAEAMFGARAAERRGVANIGFESAAVLVFYVAEMFALDAW